MQSLGWHSFGEVSYIYIWCSGLFSIKYLMVECGFVSIPFALHLWTTAKNAKQKSYDNIAKESHQYLILHFYVSLNKRNKKQKNLGRLISNSADSIAKWTQVVKQQCLNKTNAQHSKHYYLWIPFRQCTAANQCFPNQYDFLSLFFSWFRIYSVSFRKMLLTGSDWCFKSFATSDTDSSHSMTITKTNRNNAATTTDIDILFTFRN